MRRNTEPAPMAQIHKIQERIYEETKHMSVREKVDYYREARKELGLEALTVRRMRNKA